MLTHNQLTSEESQTSIESLPASPEEIDTEDVDVGPACFQCDHRVDYVDISAGESGWTPDGSVRNGGKRTVVERVRCPNCGAGGSRTRIAEDGRVVSRLGPATRNLRGVTQETRDQVADRASRGADRVTDPVDEVLLAGWSE